ncbi:MAG: hypothetical protein AAF555_05805 [Verrucomicrobiota bacterium]
MTEGAVLETDLVRQFGLPRDVFRDIRSGIASKGLHWEKNGEGAIVWLEAGKALLAVELPGKPTEKKGPVALTLHVTQLWRNPRVLEAEDRSGALQGRVRVRVRDAGKFVIGMEVRDCVEESEGVWSCRCHPRRKGRY